MLLLSSFFTLSCLTPAYVMGKPSHKLLRATCNHATVLHSCFSHLMYNIQHILKITTTQRQHWLQTLQSGGVLGAAQQIGSANIRFFVPGAVWHIKPASPYQLYNSLKQHRRVDYNFRK